MNPSYAVVRTALGANPLSVVVSLVEDGEMTRFDPTAGLLSPGGGSRRDVFRKIGQTALQAPLARNLAVSAMTQAAGQAAQHVTQKVAAPAAPSHISHPDAGKGIILPRHEIMAHAHNMFRAEHGSPVRVSPKDVDEIAYGSQNPQAIKKFDWKGHTGFDRDAVINQWREKGISKMEQMGYNKTRMSPEQWANSTPIGDLLQHHGYLEKDRSMYLNPVQPHVRAYYKPGGSTESTILHNTHDNTWTCHYSEVHPDDMERDTDHPQFVSKTESGHGGASLLPHIQGWSKDPISHVNVFKHPETGVTHVERVYNMYSSLDKKPRLESKWSSLYPPGHPSHWKSDNGGPDIRSHEHSESPESSELNRRHQDSYEKAVKSGAWQQHQEDHGDVLGFSDKREHDAFAHVESDPDMPGYDYKKVKAAYHASNTGHFVIENPLHWNNVRQGEHSPLDKKHFDAMHVDPYGKITRFRVPFDSSDRDIEMAGDGSGNLHYRTAEKLAKNVKQRFMAVQGPQLKHYELAHKSLGLGHFAIHDDDYSWLGEMGDKPVADLKHPAISHSTFEKGVLRTMIHPSGKWDVHVGPPGSAVSSGRIWRNGGIGDDTVDDSSFKHHSSGEDILSLRKSLMAARKNLGSKL